MTPHGYTKSVVVLFSITARLNPFTASLKPVR
jgi:hypothetical protein